jgi:hypothetical protein
LWTWHLLGGWHFLTHFWYRLPCQKKKKNKDYLRLCANLLFL